jgi:hypothetical protein
MKCTRAVLFAAPLALMIVTNPVEAQATRTWVSGVGNDANPCSRTAPCKTFAGAIAKTATNGEISVLDPGGYGAVSITKSITIDGAGTLASALASGVTGITVNIPAASTVTLRNIIITGIAPPTGTFGSNGINFVSAGTLQLENVTIQDFRSSTGRCIDATVASGGDLIVNNSTLIGCIDGIVAASTSNRLFVTLNNVRMQNMSNRGFQANANVTATIRNATISNNNVDGVVVTAATSFVTVVDSVIANNSNAGVNVAAGTVRLSLNTIVDNLFGVFLSAGATFESTGNNRIAGNSGGSAAPTGTFTQQ